MLTTIGLVTIAAFSQFSSHLAFTYPPHAFSISHGFFVGLSGALVLTIYDYLGYDTTAYMGGELRNPGTTMPRSIILSILAVMVLYLALEVSVLGAVPWQHIVTSSSVASLVVQGGWGRGAADVVAVLIVVTAFASVFTGLLGGSRVPYNAAHDGVFFRSFGKLHPRYRFPHVALLVMALITIIGSFFTLSSVINMLTAVIVIVQARRPDRGAYSPQASPARAAPPLPAVAVPAAEHRGPGGLDLRVRLRRSHLDHPLLRLACSGGHRLPDLGAPHTLLAVRPEADMGGVPRACGTRGRRRQRAPRRCNGTGQGGKMSARSPGAPGDEHPPQSGRVPGSGSRWSSAVAGPGNRRARTWLATSSKAAG